MFFWGVQDEIPFTEHSSVLKYFTGGFYSVSFGFAAEY